MNPMDQGQGLNLHPHEHCVRFLIPEPQWELQLLLCFCPDSAPAKMLVDGQTDICLGPSFPTYRMGGSLFPPSLFSTGWHTGGGGWWHKTWILKFPGGSVGYRSGIVTVVALVTPLTALVPV